MNTAFKEAATTVVVKRENNLPAMALAESELMDVLRNSLYPGAQDASIKMVIGYCKAAGLDPMQKPVHIVPMWDSKSSSMRDVIMPGIGSYRTQAARSGQYAGVTDPEFGPDMTERIGGTDITFPAWCKVTVRRLLPTGQIVDFSAIERWKENYASKGGKDKSPAPNAMWTRRPYAQLAKCAEAQALRKAFPEFGAQPTADEMEGRSLDENIMDMNTSEIVRDKPASLPAYTDDQLNRNADQWAHMIAEGKKTAHQIIATVSSRYTLNAEQRDRIAGLGSQTKPHESNVVDAEFVSAMDAAEENFK